jgi:glycerol-3-phosphate dehydrogenase
MEDYQDENIMSIDIKTFDIIVIGGGINGVGIAADAAGRGLSVALAEMDDLAAATSSASSKLIHGGLRYLEHGEFRLVREALAEREIILAMAPHIVTPLRFCLPHCPHLRPAALIRAGLFLYDHLAKLVTLKKSQRITFDGKSALKKTFKKGFEYSDARVDDARLVILNAQMAAKKGAHIMTRTKCISAVREKSFWLIRCKDLLTGKEYSLRSKALVNAAGPWVKAFYDESLAIPSPRSIRLIKGSHIIVPKLHSENRAYILQNKDNRIIFVIPYQNDFTLIGTTDIEYRGDPRDVSIDAAEERYLCDISNEFFQQQIQPLDIIKTFAGIRPLCDDESDSPQSITRDYTLDLYDNKGNLPLLTVFGGKLTTYRKLSQAAMHKLQVYFPTMGPDWTAGAKLPGGDFQLSVDQLCQSLMLHYPWLPIAIAARYTKIYGTCSFDLLKECYYIEDLGTHLGAGLFSLEVDYLICNEWAYSVDDIIWRRTKLELYMSGSEKQALSKYLAHKLTELIPERFITTTPSQQQQV